MRSAVCVVLSLFAGLAWSADITLPDYERVELENGVVLLLSEKHDVPLIGLRAVVRGGAVTDPAAKAGLTELLATVMQKGAGDRSAAEFAAAVAGVGGRLSISSDVEAIAVSAEFLSRDTELMIELVADVLLRPSLSAAEFVKEQERSIGLIRAAKDSDPNDLLPYYANGFLFGDHAYGSPGIGSEASLAEIEHADLIEHYANNFGGDRLIVAVVGDFDLALLKARLSRVFGDWAPAAGELVSVAAAETAPGPRVLLVDKPGATQTYFWFGDQGVALDYPQRAELNLANTVFGDRFTSMLITELRVNEGLTYSARSTIDRRSQPGSVMIKSFTETGTTVEAIDLAISLLGRLHESGLDDAMIASARNYIMGQFPPSLETGSSVASMLAFLELHGLDRGYIDEYGAMLTAATRDGIAKTIAEVYPDQNRLVFTIIGDADVIRDDIAKYGPVTEMSITEPRFRP